MICKKCGFEVTGDFCRNCGEPVKKDDFISEVVGETEVLSDEYELSGETEILSENAFINTNDDLGTENITRQDVNPNIPPYATVSVTYPGKGTGIAAMILGIIALAFSTIFACCGLICLSGNGLLFTIPISFLSGLVGFILAIISKKAAKKAGFKNKMANIGFILSLISLIISVVVFLLIIIAVIVLLIIFGGAGIGDFISSFAERLAYEDINNYTYYY